MKMKTMTVAVLGIALLGTYACSKDDNSGNTNQPIQTVTASNIVADTILGIAPSGQPYGSGKFTFFSLERNTVVPSSDSATNKWDIGFRGTTIITNSGNSGPGQGGAFVFIGLFDDLLTIPADSVFRVDNAPSSYAIPTGSNRGWYVYNAPVNLVTPVPGRVLVIRTATGKYAKLEILNYYRGGVTPAATASDDDKLRNQRFYTFRYRFQPDGTKTF
ncbi:MAG: HmuY family protein [Chitinophagaceae bacterium]|jgi:hypothetical protein|nr:HmuY family protein [Chitinophagaceae bacterium]